MKHVDMRKLPAAAQEERRRQVVGLRRAGQTYDAIAAQVGLTRTGVGSGRNLGRYAASWIACWPKRPSSTAALT